MNFLSGFESTNIFGSGRDVLDTTGHVTHYRADLALAARMGIKTLRYSIPWHKIEREPGRYDWTWMDRAMEEREALGLDIIADPLHHTSFPEWLTDGFADPRFVSAYAAFVLAFARRYPAVMRFTHINEPLVTSWFCGQMGVWHPRRTGSASFVGMALNCAEAICRIDRALRDLRPVQFVHVESCECHYAEGRVSAAEVALNNHRRFLIHDLISGRADCHHPMYGWLRRHGMTEERAGWFEQYPARVDVLGLDYYQHCELWWSAAGRVAPPRRQGFAGLAMEYARRYPECDVMLSETNVRGTPPERVAHFRHMLAECARLERWLEARGRRFVGFCWYPFVDSTDWSNLVTRATGHVDPQGIYSLGERMERIETEFTRAFRFAARRGDTCA